MKTWVSSLALAVALSSAAYAADIPLRDFFRNPEQSNFTLSPDGKSVAFLAPWEARRNIVVRMPGQPDRRVTEVKDRDLSGYFWKGNQRLVYSKDNGGDENFHLYAVDLVSGKSRDLTPFPGVRAEIVDELTERDGTTNCWWA
ncbi:hypothetical protein JOS77_04810 [Chromobacterium haemolyticum]|nr:hypothetical protein JOS77_04810 [Chromobacterium haemolyticum]